MSNPSARNKIQEPFIPFGSKLVLSCLLLFVFTLGFLYGIYVLDVNHLIYFGRWLGWIIIPIFYFIFYIIKKEVHYNKQSVLSKENKQLFGKVFTVWFIFSVVGTLVLLLLK